MSVARSRILDLIKVRCRIFSTTFNPEGLRTGNKILRQRLKGHALAAYYPRKMFSFKEFRKAWPDFEVYDEDEVDRFEAVDRRKARGKGAPKKKRTAAESKKLKGKKR